MHFNASFLLCAFLAVCSELAAYQGNKYTVRSASLRRTISLVLGRPEYGHPTYSQPRYYRRSQAAGLEQPSEVCVPIPEVHAVVPPEVEVHVPVPEVEVLEHEINIPVEEPVDFVDEPEVFVHEAPMEHEQELLPHEAEIFPSESEVPLESLVAPLEHEELPLLEEPVVHESAPKSDDLSVLYDFMYPMVLRKCLASAISSSMGSHSEDPNVNYKHQMKYIDHPLVQISGLDTLEELRRNLTAVAASRRRFSGLPKMTSGCVFHFNEIVADMQAAKEDLLMAYAESSSEEGFHLDNKYILKYERLFKKDFKMHLIIRKLYELLRNHTSIYNVILALDADLEKYINYWNTKH